MCSSMLSLKFFVYSKSHSAHSENRDQRMRQLVAYKGLKTMENINHQAQKMVLVAYGRWLFTRGSNCKALTVFFRLAVAYGGGRLREVVAHGVRLYSERVGDVDPNGAVYLSL